MQDPSLTSLVYHYTSLATFLELIAPNMRLRLSTLANMNDPKDYKIRSPGFFSRSKGDDSELISALTRVYAEFRSSRICALSTCIDADYSVAPDFENYHDHVAGRGFALPQMWAQYGDAHRGVCIALDRDALSKELDHSDKDLEYLICEPISYDDIPAGRVPATFVGVPDTIEEIPDRLMKHLQRNSKYLFFSKNTAWSMEREFRLLVGLRESKGEFFVDITKAFQGLYLGMECENVYLPSVLRSVSRNIPVTKLWWEDGVPTEHQISRKE